MLKTLTLFCAFAFLVLIASVVVVTSWAVPSAEAHGSSDNCLHNNPNHKHCTPPSGGGGLIVAAGLVSNNDLRYSTGTTLELGLSVESNTQLPLPRDGELVSLAVRPVLNTYDQAVELTVRLNGADTTLQVSVPAASTSVEIMESVVNVVAGDLVSLEIDSLATTTGAFHFFATYEYRVQ